jgi:hypothetical protein
VRPLFAATALALSTAASAQDVVVRAPADDRAAEIVRRMVAGPHVVRAGSGALVLSHDSTIASSLLVLGRPTYLAGRVRGDVVVVGADLFLRPGVEVGGRAVAIGGTVTTTTLGQVAGGVESFRDETFDVASSGGAYTLTAPSRPTVAVERDPLLAPAFLFPKYDRVDGLSLPLGATLQLGGHVVELVPSVTYRSRLGAFDPGVALRVAPERTIRIEGRFARDTRTNDAWIYGDLVNSVTTFFAGSDVRNYFRSDIGEGRVIARLGQGWYTLEPYLGARDERVWGITSAGNVFSVVGRHSDEKMARPNPLVEEGRIGSALLGADLDAVAGVVAGRLRAGVEQSYRTPAATSRFLQLTLDGSVEFPTFGLQRLHVHARGVASHGDSVPRARFAYLGGSGTLRTLEPLEQGGTALVYVENRYLIPIPGVQLPVIGAPVVTLRDAFGAAGVGALPALQHEIGIGIGLSVLHLDYTRAVAGRSGSEIGVGISLSP